MDRRCFGWWLVSFLSISSFGCGGASSPSASPVESTAVTTSATPAERPARCGPAWSDDDLLPQPESSEDESPHETLALLRPSVAQRELGTIPLGLVKALLRRDFASVAALVGPEGICLRPSKGGPCIHLSAEEFAACGEDPRTQEWPIDTGADEVPILSCGDALTEIFVDRDFATEASVAFNQFPDGCRGNNCMRVVQPPGGRVYVVFDIPGDDYRGVHFEALWLVFTGDRGCMRLSEIMREYWGI